jgi:hypothetical protein
MAQDKLGRLADRKYVDEDIRDWVCDQVIGHGTQERILSGELVLPDEQDARNAKAEYEQLLASHDAGKLSDDVFERTMKSRNLIVPSHKKGGHS